MKNACLDRTKTPATREFVRPTGAIVTHHSMRRVIGSRRAVAGLSLLLAITASIGGCGLRLFSSGSAITTSSAMSGEYIAADLPIAIFASPDDSTVDAFLTDLPLARLADPADTLSDLSGSIVHVHIFLIPEAGKTPIDDSALNAAVRHVVIARGAVGEYVGGGFVAAGDPPALGEGDSYGADIRSASLHISRAGGAFADKLGPAVISGSFSAIRDEKACRVVAARLAQFSMQLPKVDAQVASTSPNQ